MERNTYPAVKLRKEPHIPTKQAVKELKALIRKACKDNDYPAEHFLRAIRVSPWIYRYKEEKSPGMPLSSYIKMANAIGYSVVLVKRDGPAPIETSEEIKLKILQLRRVKANQQLKKHGKKPKRVDEPARITVAKKPRVRIPSVQSRSEILHRYDENDFLHLD